MPSLSPSQLAKLDRLFDRAMHDILDQFGSCIPHDATMTGDQFADAILLVYGSAPSPKLLGILRTLPGTFSRQDGLATYNANNEDNARSS